MSRKRVFNNSRDGKQRCTLTVKIRVTQEQLDYYLYVCGLQEITLQKFLRYALQDGIESELSRFEND